MELLGGLYIYYYFVCKRKLWFYAHKINMEHESELVEIGKYIELFYKEEHKKEKKIIIDNIISPDVLEKTKEAVIVYEIKKSSKFKEAALWQLKYYLWYLQRKGLKVRGKLVIPEENKDEYIELTEKDIETLKKILEDIRKIVSKDKPPGAIRREYCNRCSYKYLCFTY